MSAEAAEDIETRLVLEGIFARYGYDLRDSEPTSMRRRVQLALPRSGARHSGERFYFNARLCDRAQCVLSDGLVQGGFLCVGQSEAVPAGTQGFRELERSAPIYRTGQA